MSPTETALFFEKKGDAPVEKAVGNVDNYLLTPHRQRIMSRKQEFGLFEFFQIIRTLFAGFHAAHPGKLHSVIAAARGIQIVIRLTDKTLYSLSEAEICQKGKRPQGILCVFPRAVTQHGAILTGKMGWVLSVNSIIPKTEKKNVPGPFIRGRFGAGNVTRTHDLLITKRRP